MRDRAGRNIVFNAVGEGLWGLLSGLVASSTVLVVLLRQYGASTVMVGAVTAIEIASTLAPQLLGSLLFASRQGRQRRLVAWHFVAIIPFLLAISAIAFFAPRWQPGLVRWLVLVSFGCYMSGIGVVLAAWFDWLSGVFARTTRGRALGLGFGSSALLNLAGGLAAGRLLALQDRLPAFALLYLLASLAGTASILTFGLLIDDPESRRPDDRPPMRLAEMTAWFRRSLADRNFRRFLAGRLLAMAGFTIVPFLAIFYTSAEGGSLAAAEVVTLGVFMPVGAALSNFAFGWLGDRHGHRIGVMAGAALQTAAIAAALLGRGAAGCAAAYFAAGLCGGAAAVSHLNMVFETCPHDHRLAHITIANLVLSAGVVFPLLSGVVVERLGLATLLRASLAASGGAFIWYLAMVREPRRSEGHGGTAGSALPLPEAADRRCAPGLDPTIERNRRAK
jgi:MFS family permease